MGNAKKRRSIEFLRQKAVVESSRILGYDVSHDPNKPSLLSQGFARMEQFRAVKKSEALAKKRLEEKENEVA